MLDAKDIQVLQDMFVGQDVRIDQRLDQKFTTFRDEMFERMDQKIDGLRDELSAKITQECSRVREDVIDVINTGIHPQIDKLNHRVSRLERWARMA